MNCQEVLQNYLKENGLEGTLDSQRSMSRRSKALDNEMKILDDDQLLGSLKLSIKDFSMFDWDGA